jgi:hypothetical protein
LRVPEGVIGLQTAAVYHEMTERLPAHLQASVPRSRAGRLRLTHGSEEIIDTVTSRTHFILRRVWRLSGGPAYRSE